MHGILSGDSGCKTYPDTVTDSPTNGKMKCTPVGVASTSSYYLQVYDTLKYTMTKNSPNSAIVDYTFIISTTALGPSPTLTSLTYTLQA